MAAKTLYNKEWQFGEQNPPGYWQRLTVVQNSQDQTHGTSNITITLVTWSTRTNSHTYRYYDSTNLSKPILTVDGSNKISESDWLVLDYLNHSDTTQYPAITLKTWTGDIQHDLSTGKKTIVINAGLWVHGNSGATSLIRKDYYFTDGGSTNIPVVLDDIQLQWTLSIDSNTGINVTVYKKNSSGSYIDRVYPGDTLYYGDLIQINYSLDDYYSLSSLKFNGTSITYSEYKTSVTGGASIVARASRTPTVITGGATISISDVPGDQDTVTKQLNGNDSNVFIKYATFVNFNMAVSTNQGATISNITDQYGKVYTNNSDNVIHAIAGTNRTITITDSTGNTKSINYDLESLYTVIKYFNATGFVTASWLNQGIEIRAEFKCFSGKFGTNSSAVTNQFIATGRYKKSSDSSWDNILGSEFTSISVDTSTGTVVVTANIPSSKVDYHSNYNIEITLNDSLTSIWEYVSSYGDSQPLECKVTSIINKNDPIFDFGPNDFRHNTDVLYNHVPTWESPSVFQNRCTIISGGYHQFGKKVEVSIHIKLNINSGQSTYVLIAFPTPGQGRSAALNVSKREADGKIFNAYISANSGSTQALRLESNMTFSSDDELYISGSYWTD